MIIRLSATMLDSYLWGMSNEDMTSEELARELFLGKQQTIAMKCGTAFHNLLEHNFNYELAQSQGFNFLFSDQLDGTVELVKCAKRNTSLVFLMMLILFQRLMLRQAQKLLITSLLLFLIPKNIWMRTSGESIYLNVNATLSNTKFLSIQA